VVTDHHQPGERLPDCPVVATRPSEYPFPELCGTGVAYKLFEALGAAVEAQLDLVALATIADVVPLVDENRGLAIAGLRRLALAQVEGWPEATRRRRGYVLADEGWHEGVIGIVASRLVERFHRPVVLIAGADGEWKGSGRSIGTFDLHGGLAACAAHLEGFGG